MLKLVVMVVEQHGLKRLLIVQQQDQVLLVMIRDGLRDKNILSSKLIERLLKVLNKDPLHKELLLRHNNH